QDRPPHPSVALTRPRRLTTVAAEPQILPLNPMPAQTLPETGTSEEGLREGAVANHDKKPVSDTPPEGRRSAPVVVVQEVSQKDDTVAEDLPPVRLRPRRVIVIR
ncbi:hypothetical protein, partial [Tabrizicola caldifontis]|uniref:hypothetical protein n=1 Tax=Tabrizicola caldifontis TaxID=2528036 RepID=UPI00198090B5